MILESGLTLEQAKNANFVRGKGCNHCQKTGYKGRLGIFELMMINSKIREMIFADSSSTQLRDAAISQGMMTLYSDGLDKVMRGITTFEEVHRVAKQTEADGICISKLGATD